MSCKYGRIGVFISSFLCTNIHIPKIVGILDLFRETHRIMTQYWLVFLVFSIAFSRRRKECANMVELVFSLVHSLNKLSHSKNRGNLGCFLRSPSKHDAILGSVSSIAFSRRRKECANMVELVFSLVHPFVQTVTFHNSWESRMFFLGNRSKYDAI